MRDYETREEKFWATLPWAVFGVLMAGVYFWLGCLWITGVI